MARNCGNLAEKGRKQFLPEAWKIPIIMLAEGVNMATDAPPPLPPPPTLRLSQPSVLYQTGGGRREIVFAKESQEMMEFLH